jgi:ubiquinone/menaquinone biosynthesis C-methylase UbiE
MKRESIEYNFKFEQDYWWFVGRRKIIGNLIKKFFNCEKKSFILDAGCGTGLMLNDLKKYAISIGMDRSEVALNYAKTRMPNMLTYGDVCNLPFKDRTFDLITVLGVLYNRNVASDDVALREFSRVLNYGGILVIDEAAYNFLQSKHNESVDGIRRYTRKRLVDKVRSCGLTVLKSSYWNMLMLPLFAAIAAYERFNSRKQFSKLRRIPGVFNYILKRYLYYEAFLMKYISFPFGPSLTIVAKK